MTRLSYVIITAARNESANIGRLLTAVTSQTHRPEKWIIVDDRSIDGTVDIIRGYLSNFHWIELVERHDIRERSFAAKVDCFNEGLRRVEMTRYEVIGNIDADVSFGPDYFEFLLHKFVEDPYLGVAGTPFDEDNGYSSIADSFEGEQHVAGGCQLFRKACFEEIGGYVPNRQGGIDWIAVTTARMRGWTTRSFRDRIFHHHRPLGTGESNSIVACFNYGRKDYYLGNHPLWEVLRIFYRMVKKPYLAAGLVIFAGYLTEAFQCSERPISNELLRFHRREEITKLKVLIRETLASLTKGNRPSHRLGP